VTFLKQPFIVLTDLAILVIKSMIFCVHWKILSFIVIKQKQFKKDIVWNLFGNVVSKGSVFFVSILTARMLSPEDFGRVSYIYQTVALIVIFASMGLSVTAIRFTADALVNGRNSVRLIVKKITILVLGFSVLSIALIAIFQEQMLSILQVGSEQAFVIWILLPIVTLTAINQVQFGVMSGIKKFKSLAITNTLAGLSSIPIAYILVSQWLIKGYLVSLLITTLLTTVFNRIFIFRAISKISKIEPINSSDRSYNEILNFAWPNLISSIMFTGATWFSFSLLANKNLMEVAAFNVSNQLLGVLFLFPTICAQVLMSYTSKENLKSRELFKKSLLFNGVLATVLVLIMMVFSRYLLGLYGPHYQDFTLVLNLCLVTLVVMALSSQVEHYMVGLGMVKSHLSYTAVFSLIFVGMSCFLLDYGAVGIAVSRLVAYIIKFFISFLYVNKVDYASSN